MYIKWLIWYIKIILLKLGRGTTSHAYIHSLHDDHHVFINLHTLKVNKY